MAALYFGAIALSPYAILSFIFVLVVIGLLELGIAFRERGSRPATPVAIVAGLVMFYGAYETGASAQALGLVVLVFGALVWTLLDRSQAGAAGSIGATCLMTVWVPFCASFAGLLLARDEGSWLLTMTIALTVTADIGAYAWGSAFGRHKLAPTVSPSKSWEGLAGSIVTVLAFAAAVTATVVPGIDVRQALVIGFGIALAATLGDLAESLVKRDLGVKDLGRILPGHGGIMDRVDAMILTLPATHLILLALGL